jgi:hypothetical protein
MTITKITDEERAQWRAYARTLDDKFREYIGAEVFTNTWPPFSRRKTW